MSGLYRPGRNVGGNKQKSPGYYSAVPRGRSFQLDFNMGKVVVDKLPDEGQPDFADDVERLRSQGASDEELELFQRYGNLESGTSVFIGLSKKSGQGIRFNLTRCTEEELMGFLEAAVRAVNEALPEVRRRDEEARRAEEEGFYGLNRVTRSSPQILDLGRKRGEYIQELQVGRASVHPVGDPEGTCESEPDSD